MESPQVVTTGFTVVELADAYHEFCKGCYRRKDGTQSEWLAHTHVVLHSHLSDMYGHTPAADFGKGFKAIRRRLIDAGNFPT